MAKCPSGALTCTYNHDVTVEFDEEGSRSIAKHGDTVIGECDLEAGPEGWNIYHTEVDPSFSGKQIAKRLVFKVLEEADRKKIPVGATCSYAAKVMK